MYKPIYQNTNITKKHEKKSRETSLKQFALRCPNVRKIANFWLRLFLFANKNQLLLLELLA